MSVSLRLWFLHLMVCHFHALVLVGGYALSLIQIGDMRVFRCAIMIAEIETRRVELHWRGTVHMLMFNHVAPSSPSVHGSPAPGGWAKQGEAEYATK